MQGAQQKVPYMIPRSGLPQAGPDYDVLYHAGPDHALLYFL